MSLKRKSSEDAIVDAAIAVLAANPGASLSEIALAAGVGRATLHRLYGSRAELIDEISLRAIEETNQATREAVKGARGARERLERMLEAVVPLGDRFHFIMSEPISASKEVWKDYQGELDWVRELVKKLRAEGVIGRRQSVEWAVATIDALIWGAWREVHAGRLAPADAPRIVCETVLGGLGESPGRVPRPSKTSRRARSRT